MKQIMWIIMLLLLAAVSSCPDCCTIYVVLDTSTDQSLLDSCPCSITVNELSQIEWNLDNATESCTQREFLFQSGIHQSNSSLLAFISINEVIIRGEPNAIIKCLNETFALDFHHTPNITIRDMQIWNCLCSFYGIYTGDVTTNGTVDSVDPWPVVIEIKIMNSKFINSRLVCMFYVTVQSGAHINSYMLRTQSMDAIITIKNTITTNCSKLLPFVNIDMEINDFFVPNVMLHMIMENFNFLDNCCPLIAPHNLENEFDFCFIITFTGHNNFARNKVSLVEIPVTYDYKHNSTCKHTLLFTTTEVYITNNINTRFTYWGIGFKQSSFQALIYIIHGNIIFKHCHVIFRNNSGGHGAGIMLIGDSEMVFKDNVSVVFDNNTGAEGGPLYLQASTAIIFNTTAINSTITLQFKNNKAKRGGAILVEDKAKYIKSIFDLQCSTALVTLIFVNNSASLGGNQIYGGWVDWLQDQDGVIRYRPDTMKEIFNFNNSSDSEVSSCAIRVCLCKDGHPECNITNTTIEIYGYTVSLDLVAVGQRFTPVKASIMANVTSSKSRQRIDTWEKLWMTTNMLRETCTNVIYKVFSTQADTLLISPDPVPRDCTDFYGNDQYYDSHMPKYAINDSVTVQAMLIFQQLSIHFKSRKCPIGFFLHRINRNCACQPSLLSLGLSCDTISIKIRRNKHQWVAIAHQHTVTSSMVILHPYCPFDYCRTDNESLSIRLEDKSELCAFNRSGILCGGCATNFSRVLGSSRCEVCSMNFQMFAIILTWFLSGPILVLLLMLLDITVSVGTINGLTFYANVIHAQRATFFTLKMSSPFLSMFIAWLNLDQGFETCFYNGLDEYTIAWLKFLFPLYIWLIAAVLIMISHYSTRISNLIGNNAVQVLATLFFISYTKLLQLIIEVFSFTTLNYPDGYRKTVWLIDGNIEFLKGKHIPLFLVTVIFILFSFPYTIILLIIQFLYKISHYRTMFWVQRLKPLFDAYIGPYRDNHHYWTGLLLIARIVLLMVFTLNKKDDMSINLFSIILVSSVLVGWVGLISGSVYKHPLNNLLEVAFLCNLGITSTVVFFNSKGITVAVNVSVTLALIILVGIVIFHAQRRLLLTNFASELKKQASKFTVSQLKQEVVNCGYKLRQFCKWERKSLTVVPTEPLLIEAEPEQQGTY